MTTTSEKSAFSVLGCAHKFGLALERAGGEPADMNRAAEDKVLMEGFLALVRGRAKLALVKHVIDLDAAPFVPDGWEIAPPEEQIRSRATGLLEFDPSKVALHLELKQKDSKTFKGTELRKRLEGKPVLSANVLDWFLAHPEAIPESWKVDENGKNRHIYFWGTMYRRSSDFLCARCLYWRGDGWSWDYAYFRWCCSDFGDQNQAAVLA